MSDAAIDARPQRSTIADLLIAALLIAVAVPLALLTAAYALWAISDRLLVIGPFDPFDRAAFAKIVVIPISLLAPGIGGMVWSRMPADRQRLAALLLGGAVAVLSAGLLAKNIDYACAPVTSWTTVLAPALVVGVLIGLGPALGALAAASVDVRSRGFGRPAAAIIAGGVVGVVGLFAATLVFAFLFPVFPCAYVPF